MANIIYTIGNDTTEENVNTSEIFSDIDLVSNQKYTSRLLFSRNPNLSSLLLQENSDDNKYVLDEDAQSRFLVKESKAEVVSKKEYTPTYQIVKDKNIEAVKNSLRNIFNWIPGERIINPEFGSELRKILYEGITDFNSERIMAEIRGCVQQWEPRVQITNVYNVSTVDDTENNTVHIEIQYTIPALTNETYSLDYYGQTT